MIPILGLDIGGANLKAAHTEGVARTVPFALWKNPGRLTAELASICGTMPRYDRLAVTMTGEQCDCYASQEVGVRAILESVRVVAGGMPVRVWAPNSNEEQPSFTSLEGGPTGWRQVAAGNWLALASYVGRLFPTQHVLLLDIGSTTTDITYLRRSSPEPWGRTDWRRLREGNLVYTGARRTPICAILGADVAAEFFATMHDAYLVLGMIPEDSSDCDTADGRPATKACAGARLARMLCMNPHPDLADSMRALALRAATVQQQTIQQAAERVLAERRALDRIVLAGSGEFIGRIIHNRHASWQALPLTSMSELLGPARSEAACAYAVAMLAQLEGEGT